MKTEAVRPSETSEHLSTPRRHNPKEDHQMITPRVKLITGGMCDKHCALTGVRQCVLRTGLTVQHINLKAILTSFYKYFVFRRLQISTT